MSSILGRTFEQALKKGQDQVSGSISSLTDQNNTMIENQNEMIMLMKKICDKLGIETNIEKEN